MAGSGQFYDGFTRFSNVVKNDAGVGGVIRNDVFLHFVSLTF